MRKRKLFMAFLCLFLIAVGCGVIYGKTSTKISNRFKTGFVDINLTEYKKDGDRKETLWSDESLSYVMAGDVISRTPRIHVYGSECYVRARVVLCSEDGSDLLLSENVEIHGMEDTWVQAGDGYFYYKEPLSYGDEVDVFQAVSISENFPKTMQGRSFHMDVEIDAIQSDNFLPNFEAESPWGNVEIIELQNKTDNHVSYFRQKPAFEIVYKGEADNLIANADDFFVNIPSVMPGDIYHDTISLFNDQNKDIKMYFRSVFEDEAEFSRNINLKITTKIGDEEEIFYDGKLGSDELQEDIVMAVIPQKSSASIEFEVHVPHALGNAFAGLDGSVNWIFSTEAIKEDRENDSIIDVEEPNDDKDAISDNEDTSDDKDGILDGLDPNDRNSDFTEDKSTTNNEDSEADNENASNKKENRYIFGAVCIGSTMSVITVLGIFWFFIIWKRRKKKEEEENDDVQK